MEMIIRLKTSKCGRKINTFMKSVTYNKNLPYNETKGTANVLIYNK